ncbi:aminoacyl-tRNA hydrolase [Brevibacterium sp. 5221]|uniref:Peptidyl-tRNA hydrolase n=1 Tax=Brevibacterium rongguiense TaxID=2695267 RepID=A0A6N9H7S6_9MICO|nr:aminoacyl-tRNA hydrolase [Brevibacterium rongguiense]MYM20009.1 aminoacyl-tRNA hydrolase [Brevibacterium rongguiense]
MAETWLIAGLGNPGRQYEGTRHSIGQLVIDELVHRAGGRLTSTKARVVAAVERVGARGGVPGPRAVLVKPLTYMNVSGPPIAQLAKFYSVPPERVVAIHDDVDLPFEAIRLKLGGGEGGHNGLRSLTQALGTKDYLRLRAGVGRPPGRMDTADFVLQRFSAGEQQTLPIFVGELADALEELLADGLEATQQRWHSR